MDDPGLVPGVDARFPEFIRPRRIRSRRVIPSCLLSEFFSSGLRISSSSPNGYGGGVAAELIAAMSLFVEGPDEDGLSDVVERSLITTFDI